MLFDSFFDSDTPDFQYISSVLQFFDTCVLLTSDARIAMGNTVVLDGGATVFQGEAEQAKQVVEKLHWLSRVFD